MYNKLEEKAVKKQLIITELFESGGSNSHFKTLVQYFKPENIILGIEDVNQISNLKNIIPNTKIKYQSLKGLYQVASLTYKTTSNIKEGLKIIHSLIKVFFLSFKYNFANVTVSAVAPEKHLYLLWLPFLRVTYILHSLPNECLTPFTKLTCNNRLGRRKKIVVVSNAMNNILCEKWGIKDNVRQNVVTVYNTSLADIQLPKPNTKEDKPQIVLTIGRIDENKNPKTWFEVAKTISAKYKPLNFLWLGDGPLLNEYQALSNSYKNIEFLGHTQDVSPFLSKTIIYYQPSHNESHGIAVLEAMQNSLPCIVSNVGGLVESVINEVNGLLVSPSNVEEHIEAFDKLLTEGNLDHMGRRSLERYNTIFSYPKFKLSMDKIFLN